MSYILKLSPVIKQNIWGGEKIKEIYGVESDKPLGEAWTLCVHKDGENIVENGKYKGKPLSFALKEMGSLCLGEKCKEFKDFPQLIKIIDTSDYLSVQVHPDDNYAIKNEGQYGKTEMWYIIEAKEDGGIYYGLNSQLTKEQLKEMSKDGSIEQKLEFVKVKKGECYFVPPGTIHAIGKNVTIAEVQQNSNLTYRLYDFLRKDKEGNYRELHIEKASEVAVLTPLDTKQNYSVENLGNTQLKQLPVCKFFNAKVFNIKDSISLNTNDSFASVLVLSGNARIDGMPMKTGDSFFVPANYGEYSISGECEILISEM